MNFATVHPNFTRLARTAMLVGCSLVGTLGVAQAAAPSDAIVMSDAVPSVVVRYGDLNLATEAGARTLYRRLSFAAQEVCPVQDSRSLALWSENRTCRADAIARAVHEVNSTQLAALHAEHSNRG